MNWDLIHKRIVIEGLFRKISTEDYQIINEFEKIITNITSDYSDIFFDLTVETSIFDKYVVEDKLKSSENTDGHIDNSVFSQFCEIRNVRFLNSFRSDLYSKYISESYMYISLLNNQIISIMPGNFRHCFDIKNNRYFSKIYSKLIFEILDLIESENIEEVNNIFSDIFYLYDK